MERKPRGLTLRVSASQSFTEDEVSVLDAIISTVLRGGDARILARSRAARTLMQKVQTMKASCKRRKAMHEKTLGSAQHEDV